MGKRIFTGIFLSFVLVSLFLAGLSFANNTSPERILSFHSDIKVHADGSMAVVETIKVISAAGQIKHGIYRDFPTKYKDNRGNNYVVGFKLKGVLRDGKEESHHLSSLNNGVRIYIGSKTVELSPGEYTYILAYDTDRQLGFFPGFDELYWNVTGNGWAFVIDEASSTIELPGAAGNEVKKVAAYTGSYGSKGKNFTYSVDMDGKINFVTTRSLDVYEGLTVAVSWPKGYVQEPDLKQKFNFFLKDNLGAVLGFFGLMALASYYIIVWLRFGRDPAKGTIIPLYAPPERFSPAAVRFLMKMGYDNKAFAASIINMAVKGFLTINEKDGVYTLTKTGSSDAALAAEESEINRQLFGTAIKIKLKNENHEYIQTAILRFQQVLKSGFEKNYFITNWKYFIPGVIISIFVVLISLIIQSIEHSPITVFLIIWLFFWSIGLTALLLKVFALWKEVFRKPQLLGQALFLSIFSLPFVFGELMVIGILIHSTSIFTLVILTVGVFLNFLFYQLLKAPTLLGRKIMDKIEGFKMYLSVAEKDHLDFMNPPQKTPELFERFLPYALALDVEQAWAEQFSNVLQQASEGTKGYIPVWYAGRNWNNFGSEGFVSGLGGSLSSAISSSAVAPGSSSGGGSGGGGSSGGGGGGGGGGGW